MAEARPLRVLLFNGQYDLAAHRLVYGLIKVRIEQNGKKKRKQRKSK